MEVSPVKSLEVISDSEGEEDCTGDTSDMFPHNPYAGTLSAPRDWHHHYSTATMASYNPSSDISKFPSIPGEEPSASSIGSSIQAGSEWFATKSRPRPRIRPIPSNDTDASISMFSTMQPTLAQPSTETVSSFNNSAVPALPVACPPSLPPSSFPTADSLYIQPPTSPVPGPLENTKPKPKQNGPMNESVGATPSSMIYSPSNSTNNPTFPTLKRPRPKMRPPPTLEPDSTIHSTSTTTPSIAHTDSSANLNNNPSTSATTNSASSKSGSARQRSALDDAEEYTGRGARRLAQQSSYKQDDYVDVGGPEEEAIVVIESSDSEHISKRKLKPKPKPKKKPSPSLSTNESVQLDAELLELHGPNSSTRVPLAAANSSKQRPSHPQTSEDEFARWDNIPGGPSIPTKNGKRHRKTAARGSDDETNSPPAPTLVSNTIARPNHSQADLSHAYIPSSPLSSPGHSPASKRKLETISTVEQDRAPAPAKKPRKMEVVLPTSAAPREAAKRKSKPRTKGKGKSAATDTAGPSGCAPADAEGPAYVPPALDSVVETPPNALLSEPSRTQTISHTSDGASLNPSNLMGTGPDAELGVIGAATSMDVDSVFMDAEPEIRVKKPPKKRATKGKKGAAAATITETVAVGGDGEIPPAGKKKSVKGKGKGKEKEVVESAPDIVLGSNNAIDSNAPASHGAPNPDTGTAATSSNSNTGANSEASLSALNQTPAPKPSRTKPRHSITPTTMPVAMGSSGALLRTTGRKSSERPLAETLRLSLGGTGTPPPRVGLSRRGSSKIAPLLAMRGVPPPPPPPMPKKPVRKKKGQSDDEDSEEGPEWEKLTEKQKEKKRRDKQIAGWYSD